MGLTEFHCGQDGEAWHVYMFCVGNYSSLQVPLEIGFTHIINLHVLAGPDHFSPSVPLVFPQHYLPSPRALR